MTCEKCKGSTATNCEWCKDGIVITPMPENTKVSLRQLDETDLQKIKEAIIALANYEDIRENVMDSSPRYPRVEIVKNIFNP